MSPTSQPDLTKYPARALLLLLIRMTLALRQLLPRALPILAPAGVVRVSLGPRHVHPHEVIVRIELCELVPEFGRALLRDGDGAEAPEGQEGGFIRLEGRHALFAAADAVAEPLGAGDGLFEEGGRCCWLGRHDIVGSHVSVLDSWQRL